MTFRVRIDPVALRHIDEFAAYLRNYSDDFAIEQHRRVGNGATDAAMKARRCAPLPTRLVCSTAYGGQRRFSFFVTAPPVPPLPTLQAEALRHIAASVARMDRSDIRDRPLDPNWISAFRGVYLRARLRRDPMGQCRLFACSHER